MAIRTIADTVTSGGVPQNGIAVSAYKASRLGTIPAQGTAPPGGGPDAGPVTSGGAFGGSGEFRIDCPTIEDYYCYAVIVGVPTWQFYPSPDPPATITDLATVVAVAGVAQTLDASLAAVFDLTLSAASCALTFAGAVASRGTPLRVRIRQGATGGRLITVPPSTLWAHGAQPTLTAAAFGVDIIDFYCLDQAANVWMGFYGGPDMRSIAPSFAGLVAWYKADSLALPDATAVASWPDSSGITGALVAAGAAQPTFKVAIVNGLPVVRFNGTANGMQSSGNLTVNDLHVFMVVYNVTAMNMMYEQSANGGANPGSYMFTSGNNSSVNRSAVLGTKNDLAGTWANGAGVTNLLEHSYAGAGPAQDLWKNGVKQGATVAAPAAGAAAVDKLNVGARNNAAALFVAADIGEIIIYNRSLVGAPERAVLISYLNSRWGTAFV